MAYEVTDPLTDSRWRALAEHHRHATIFHTPEWLSALHRTYGFQPQALVSVSPDGVPIAGLAYCSLRSWLTGARVVSLPFSDHCDPLAEDGEGQRRLVAALRERVLETKAGWLEIRPSLAGDFSGPGLRKSASYCLHKLDLRPRLAQLYEGLHKTCFRGRIRHAQAHALQYAFGRSAALLDQFYAMMVLTRRHQALPPQPLAWFRNVIACLGEKATLHLVSVHGQPIAGIMTLTHRGVMTYKYGCSDRRYNHLGGTPLLFWRAIEQAKSLGLESLDLGRTDLENKGLILYKSRLGADALGIDYWVSGERRRGPAASPWLTAAGRSVISKAPLRLLSWLGERLYRHLA